MVYDSSRGRCSVASPLFGFVGAIGRPTLARGRHSVVGLWRLMLSLTTIALVVVIAAVSVLLAVLVSLLGAGSKVLRSRTAVPSSHYIQLASVNFSKKGVTYSVRWVVLG